MDSVVLKYDWTEMSYMPDLDKELLELVSNAENVDRVRVILSEGADPNARKIYGDINCFETALYRAAMSDSVKMVNLLLDSGARPCINGYGRTCLNVVCYRSSHWSNPAECIQLIDRLIDLGAPCTAKLLDEFVTCGCGGIHPNETVKEHVASLIN